MRGSLIALAAIVGLGAMVRCQHLGELSYNFDEAFCVKMVGFPPGDIWRRCAMDNHPPLYFYALWAWSRVVGGSPAALRSLSVAFGLAAVVGAYLLVRQIGAATARGGAAPTDLGGQSQSPRATAVPVTECRDNPQGAALAAAAMVALSPMQVEFSQQARMGYAMGAALSVISCWLLLRALDRRPSRGRDFVYYALAASALAYTHHYALFVVSGQVLYAVGWLLAEKVYGPPHPGPHPEGEGDICLHPGPFPGRDGERERNEFRSTRGRIAKALILVALLYLPWAPNLVRQREQVSRVFNTGPFAWDEMAKACYQTLAPCWEDRPASAAIAWSAAAACLAPPLAMLAWGRGGLRLIGLCVFATFDGAVCVSIGDRNIIQARYFVFANALLLCGWPALVAQLRWPLARPTPGGGANFVSAAGLVCLVGAAAWLCLLHAERRDAYARRPGMRAAMAYLAESQLPGEPVLVCNPMLQITAAAHVERNSFRSELATGGPHPGPLPAGPPGEGEKRPRPSARPEGEGEERNELRSTRPRVLGAATRFPHFQGTAVTGEGDYVSRERLAASGARRCWAIDAVEWITPELRLVPPPGWVEVSEVKFPEWSVYENCAIVVRCYEKRAQRGVAAGKAREVDHHEQ